MRRIYPHFVIKVERPCTLTEQVDWRWYVENNQVLYFITIEEAQECCDRLNFAEKANTRALNKIWIYSVDNAKIWYYNWYEGRQIPKASKRLFLEEPGDLAITIDEIL